MWHVWSRDTMLPDVNSPRAAAAAAVGPETPRGHNRELHRKTNIYDILSKFRTRSL